jgi:CHAT domain-containing protein/tetratricopeptide (TPR) repeat protein
LAVLAVLAFHPDLSARQPQTVADLDRLEAAVNDLANNGHYLEAIPYAQRALDILRQTSGEHSGRYAEALYRLGKLYSLINVNDKAEPLFRANMEIQKQLHGEDSLEYASALNVLGRLYADMELFDFAEPHLREAFRIRTPGLSANDPRYMESVNNLALVYEALGEYDAAEPLFQKLLDADTAEGGVSEAIHLVHLRNLAGLYFAEGRYDEAQPLMVDVTQVDQRRTVSDVDNIDVIQEVRDDDTLGLTYMYLGRYAEADASLLLAKKKCDTTPFETHYVCSSVLTHLGLQYQSTNRTAEALDALRAAVNGQQTDIDRGIYGIRAYVEAIRFSLDALVNVAADSHDDVATRLAFEWTLRRKALGLDVGILVARVEKFYGDERDIYERDDQIRALTRRLHKLVLNPPTGADLDDARRESAVSRVGLSRVQDELDHKFIGAVTWNNTNVETIQRLLPSGSALVEFLVVPKFDFRSVGNGSHWTSRYFAFVITSGVDSRPRLVDIGNAREIDGLVGQVRNKISTFNGLSSEKQAQGEYDSVSRELYDVLFRNSGLRRALGSVPRIYVSPDGALTRVAFEALNDSKNSDRYLAEDHTFVYLPAGRYLALAAARRPPEHSIHLGPGTVVFAAPDYNLKASERKARAQKLLEHPEQDFEGESNPEPTRAGGGATWGPLDGAIQEAKDVKAALQNSAYGPVKIYQGPNALQEVFRHVHGPRIVHVATHGYFLSSPKPSQANPASDGWFAGTLGSVQRADDPLLRSGLVFAGANLVEGVDPTDQDPIDGWMTAADVGLMDLTGTDLVVLSACDTGLGDVKAGAGVQGLQQSFLTVGARALIMTLYETPDDDQLMRRFYGLLAAGADKATALHNAQLSIIAKRRKAYGAAHPYFWGSFIFVGQAVSK